MTGTTKTNSKDDRPKVLSGIGSRKGYSKTFPRDFLTFLDFCGLF